MKQPEQPEGLTPDEQIWLRCYLDNVYAELDRGAEPYWMQDVRLAARAIEAKRAEIARQRAAHSGGDSAGREGLVED